MDKEEKEKLDKLEEENEEVAEELESNHLTPNEEAKKGVVEDFFDTAFGEDK